MNTMLAFHREFVMDFPPTIYIGLGAIVAAVITGLISFINLVASKDQKTSEFRQQWIDKLREDISEMLGHVDLINAQSKLHNLILVNKQASKLEVVQSYADKVADSHRAFDEISRRIILRLNKKDDEQLLNKVASLQKQVDGSFENMASDTHKELSNAIMDLSQALLKKEWKRVKRGEPSFWITKYSAILIVILSIWLGYMYLSEKVVITIEFPAKANVRLNSDSAQTARGSG